MAADDVAPAFKQFLSDMTGEQATDLMVRIDKPVECDTARPASEWHEDYGDVLWWRFPVTEPPYVGQPHDDGWCGDGWIGAHYTHWTELSVPADPADPSSEAQGPTAELRAELVELHGVLRDERTLHAAKVAELSTLFRQAQGVADRSMQARANDHELMQQLANKVEEVRTARDRLESLFRNAGQGEYDVLALVDKLHADIAQLTSERDEARNTVSAYDRQSRDLAQQLRAGSDSEGEEQ